MTRHLAFLRGVNLGKRQTKSGDLKAVFESLGFEGVKTVIASGNVLFESETERGLKSKIEKALARHFGFEIGVVLRSLDELRAMIASKPFAKAPKEDVALHVLLFAEPMAARPKLANVKGDYDVARIDDREIFFVVYKKPDGTFLGRSALGDIDKDLPKSALTTMRNWNTVEKIAAL